MKVGGASKEGGQSINGNRLIFVSTWHSLVFAGVVIKVKRDIRGVRPYNVIHVDYLFLLYLIDNIHRVS